MSKGKFHQLTLESKKDSNGQQSAAGAGVRVLLDGQPVKGLTAVRVNLEAGTLNKIVLEMYGYVEANILGELETKVVKVQIPEGDKNER